MTDRKEEMPKLIDRCEKKFKDAGLLPGEHRVTPEWGDVVVLHWNGSHLSVSSDGYMSSFDALGPRACLACFQALPAFYKHLSSITGRESAFMGKVQAALEEFLDD